MKFLPTFKLNVWGLMQKEVGFDNMREWKYGIGFYDFRAFLRDNFPYDIKVGFKRLKIPYDENR